jgi:hypothetical protein
MDYDRLFLIAEGARSRGRPPSGDVDFVRDTTPAELADFPSLSLPKTLRHPGGFAVSGAPVGTFMRSALLLAAQKALGKRFGGHAFYEHVESDLAMRIMRSHFQGGAPKGAFCCKQCTLAVLPVLEADAIRWFDGQPLAKEVRRLINNRAWRFSSPPNAAMLRWALGPAATGA